MKPCAYCKKSDVIIRTENPNYPHLECPGCGAITDLPKSRYRIDWSTKASAQDGRPWYQNINSREVALEVAREYLVEDLDRAVISDRWNVEKPIVLIKNEIASGRA